MTDRKAHIIGSAVIVGGITLTAFILGLLLGIGAINSFRMAFTYGGMGAAACLITGALVMIVAVIRDKG